MSISTTTTTKQLSQDQLQALLSNAYGFVDGNGAMFHCHNYSFNAETNICTLQSIQDEAIDVVLNDDATLDESTLVVYVDGGDLEQLTVLVPLALARGVDMLSVE